MKVRLCRFGISKQNTACSDAHLRLAFCIVCNVSEVFLVREKNYLVVGGDLRQIGVANALARQGAKVLTYMVVDSPLLLPEVALCSRPCLEECEGVILPLPCSKEDVYVNCTYEEKPKLEDLFAHMDSRHRVYGGKLSPYVRSLADQKNILAVDYLNEESFSIKNAVLTAEGAVQIAMEKTVHSIFGTSVFILGFGRIGKVLSAMLKSLGAKVCVAARKPEDLAWIAALGYTPVPMLTADERIGQADIVFNTAPARLVNLRRMKESALYVELASKPYGADFGTRSFKPFYNGGKNKPNCLCQRIQKNKIQADNFPCGNSKAGK